MRLFELAGPDPIVTRLVAITDQLKSELDSKKIDPQMNVDQLLKYLSDYDIVVDVSDLYNMIQKPPLKNIIDNIQGDQVIFKGQGAGAGEAEDETQSQQVVQQMAQNAMPTK
jgi:FMN-dependent NADH-azoreductase